jgi:hypothetical protein
MLKTPSPIDGTHTFIWKRNMQGATIHNVASAKHAYTAQLQV